MQDGICFSPLQTLASFFSSHRCGWSARPPTTSAFAPNLRLAPPPACPLPSARLAPSPPPSLPGIPLSGAADDGTPSPPSPLRTAPRRRDVGPLWYCAWHAESYSFASAGLADPTSTTLLLVRCPHKGSASVRGDRRRFATLWNSTKICSCWLPGPPDGRAFLPSPLPLLARFPHPSSSRAASVLLPAAFALPSPPPPPPPASPAPLPPSLVPLPFLPPYPEKRLKRTTKAHRGPRPSHRSGSSWSVRLVGLSSLCCARALVPVLRTRPKPPFVPLAVDNDLILGACSRLQSECAMSVRPARFFRLADGVARVCTRVTLM